MRFDGFQQLKREDFEEKDKSLIDKLAGIINPVLTQLEQGLNKSLDFDNFRQEIKEVIVTVDATGEPTTQTQFKNGLLTKVRGTDVIRAENLTTSTSFPTAQPFISFSENNKIVTITNVSGLQANNKYKLTVITYG
jgi:hypothetical protein